MNLDPVAICNMGLANIGQPPIQSLEQSDVASRACKLRYDEARLSTLSACLWNFASGWEVGVPFAGVSPKRGWSYVHSYPTKALRVFEIERYSKAETTIPFEVTANMIGAGKLIHSNVAEPTFVFNMDRDDIASFDWDYIQALSWKIAELVVMPIKKDAKMLDKCEKKFMLLTSIAKARTLNEGTPDSDQLAGYQKAR